MQQLFAAMGSDQRLMDAFVQMNAGTISPAAFGELVAGGK
jgi:hypothetical protein